MTLQVSGFDSAAATDDSSTDDSRSASFVCFIIISFQKNVGVRRYNTAQRISTNADLHSKELANPQVKSILRPNS